MELLAAPQPVAPAPMRRQLLLLQLRCGPCPLRLSVCSLLQPFQPTPSATDVPPLAKCCLGPRLPGIAVHDVTTGPSDSDRPLQALTPLIPAPGARRVRCRPFLLRHCWRLWRPTSFRTRPIPRSLRRPRLPAARKRRPRRRSASQVRRAAARASPPPSPPPRAPPRLLPSRRRRRLSRAVGWRCGRRARAGGTRRW